MRKNIYIAVIIGAFLLAPFNSIAHAVATIEGSALNYVHTDHLTGSNAVTNSTAGMVQLLDYYPYGSLRIDWKHGSFDEQRKFAGQEYDRETDLSYMNARYYNGGIGRFVSQDAAYLLLGDSNFEQKYNRKLEQHLADPQQLNSYSYVTNNPLKYVDETGEIAPLVVAGVYLLWQAAEAGLSAYDAYATYQTITNPEASFEEKAGSLGLLGLGLVAPGGGYKSIGSKVTNTFKNPDTAPAKISKLMKQNRSVAEKLGRGHSYNKHVIQQGEFPEIKTPGQFTEHIENILNNPSEIKSLDRGRTAYWHESSQTVIIRDPKHHDGGTALRPREGKSYFKGLK